MSTTRREDLTSEGIKLCMLFFQQEVTELFKYSIEFFAVANLDKIKRISEEEAITIYVHPESKDLITNPQEVFSLNVIDSSWSPTKSVSVYSSKGGITFEYSYDFKNPPKIKTLVPGELYSSVLCNLSDPGAKHTVRLFNSEYFLTTNNKTKRISQDEALLYYTDPKATELHLDPAVTFPSLTEISRSSESIRYKTSNDAIFDYSEKSKKAEVHIKQRGFKQRPKVGGQRI